MSNITVDKITGRTSSTETDVNDLKYQLATSHGNFNGDGVVTLVSGSHNVTSITDAATGLYTVTFITPMDNANYTISIIGSDGVSSGAQVALISNGSITTNSFQILGTTPHTGAANDLGVCHFVVHGGKN